MKERFYYFLLAANCLANLELYFPAILLTNATSGLPFALIIGLVLASVYAYMLLYVFNKYKDKNYVDICKTLFGNKAGMIISFVYMILRFNIAGFLFAGAVKGIQVYLMPTTANWYIALLLTLLIYVETTQNRRNFLYCKSFFTVIVAIWFVIVSAISIETADFNYVKGTLVHSLHMPKLAMIAPSLFYFTGVQHLVVFNTHFKKKLSIKKTLMVYYLVGLPFALISLSVPLGTWGPSAVKTLTYIQTVTMDTKAIDLFFIERVLFIAAPLLVLIIIIDIANYSYIGFELLRDMGASKRLNKASIFVVLFIYIAFTSLIGPVERLYSAAASFGIFWLFIHTVLVLLLFIGAKLKGGNNK